MKTVKEIYDNKEYKVTYFKYLDLCFNEEDKKQCIYMSNFFYNNVDYKEFKKLLERLINEFNKRFNIRLIYKMGYNDNIIESIFYAGELTPELKDYYIELLNNERQESSNRAKSIIQSVINELKEYKDSI